MQSRKGSLIIVVGLVILAIISVGIIAYEFMPKSKSSSYDNYSQSKSTKDVQELTKTDEISDIEKDLNSTNVDNLDAEVLGVTSEVE